MGPLEIFFNQIWLTYNTSIKIPWLGETSPLFMSIYLGLLSLIVNWFISLRGDE